MGRILEAGSIAAPEVSTTSFVSVDDGFAVGRLPAFGLGQVRAFYDDGTFVVPAGVEQIRVRVVGAGASGAQTASSSFAAGGGGGGGYAHGVFTVIPGASFAVTVGKGGDWPSVAQTGNPGGSSSFGDLISATGGEGGTYAAGLGVGGNGGIGVGGDFQARGGNGGDSTRNYAGGGGGGAGSQLGDGGKGGDTSLLNGGGGGGIIHPGASCHPVNAVVDTPGGGGSAFGPGGQYDSYDNSYKQFGAPDCIGVIAKGCAGAANPKNHLIRFPFDVFTGGGGAAGYQGGIGGGGGGINQASPPGTGHGGIGGGGGGHANGASRAGNGGLGAGGGGGYAAGKGGKGLVIVEW